MTLLSHNEEEVLIYTQITATYGQCIHNKDPKSMLWELPRGIMVFFTEKVMLMVFSEVRDYVLLITESSPPHTHSTGFCSLGVFTDMCQINNQDLKEMSRVTRQKKKKEHITGRGYNYFFKKRLNV